MHCETRTPTPQAMKYIRQFAIILTISFIGEVLNSIIPLPIPASIYGIAILFTALCTGVIRLEQVKETGKFLIAIMPLMFIAPAVGLIDSWDTMQSFIVAIAVISIVSTITVIAATGHATQLIIKLKRKEGRK